jgi:hypothetical protein
MPVGEVLEKLSVQVVVSGVVAVTYMYVLGTAEDGTKTYTLTFENKSRDLADDADGGRPTAANAARSSGSSSSPSLLDSRPAAALPPA